MKEPFIELLPGEIGIEDEDMKAAATTDYDGNVLDLRGYSVASIHVVIDNTGGGSNGLATLKYQRYDKSGTAVGDEIDLLTSINTKADENAVIRLGVGVTEEVLAGTAGTNDGVAVPLGRFRLTLNVQEQNDGTSCTGSVYLYAQ